MKEQTKTFFRTVMKLGGLFSSKHLSVKAVRSTSLQSEVRIVISKKVIPQATSRNRLKRRILGLFSEINPKSVQVIFFAKKGVDKISLKELRDEVNYLVRKLKSSRSSEL